MHEQQSDAFDIADRLLERLEKTSDLTPIKQNLADDLAAIGSYNDRMTYIHYVNTCVTSKGHPNLSPHSVIDLLHTLGAVVDTYTPHLTPQGYIFDVEVDVFNLVSPLFVTASRLELQLVAARQLDNITAQRIADISALFTRKGPAHYLLLDTTDRTSHDFLVKAARIVLLAETTAARYKVLGKNEHAKRLKGYTRQLTKHMGIENGSVEWAFHTMLRSMKGEPPDDSLDTYDLAFLTTLRGLYVFSPTLYATSAKWLASKGLSPIANAHARRAQRDYAIAKALGLKPRVRPPQIQRG